MFTDKRQFPCLNTTEGKLVEAIVLLREFVTHFERGCHAGNVGPMWMGFYAEEVKKFLEKSH